MDTNLPPVNPNPASPVNPVKPVNPLDRATPHQGKNKLPIIIMGVVVVLLLVVPLVLILAKGSATPAAEIEEEMSTTPGAQRTNSLLPFVKPSPKLKRQPVPTPYFAWDIYTDAKFSIAYPQTWLIEQTRETEGKTVIFKPPTVGVKEYIPSITVTVRENKEHPYLTETESYYRDSLKYSESKFLLDAHEVTKLAGTFPGKNPTQSVHVYLDKDGYSYLIKYQYAGAQYNGEYEKLFESMIANFKFR